MRLAIDTIGRRSAKRVLRRIARRPLTHVRTELGKAEIERVVRRLAFHEDEVWFLGFDLRRVGLSLGLGLVKAAASETAQIRPAVRSETATDERGNACKQPP